MWWKIFSMKPTNTALFLSLSVFFFNPSCFQSERRSQERKVISFSSHWRHIEGDREGGCLSASICGKDCMFFIFIQTIRNSGYIKFQIIYSKWFGCNFLIFAFKQTAPMRTWGTTLPSGVLLFALHFKWQKHNMSLEKWVSLTDCIQVTAAKIRGFLKRTVLFFWSTFSRSFHFIYFFFLRIISFRIKIKRDDQLKFILLIMLRSPEWCISRVALALACCRADTHLWHSLSEVAFRW